MPNGESSTTAGDTARSSLGLKEYLDATNEAAKRARLAMMALVMGTIVMLAGLLNSLSSNWMLQRIVDVTNPSGKYIVRRFGAQSAEFKGKVVDRMLSSYVDNYTVKVPVFGVTFDVNDLGFLGGLGLLTTVFYLVYCLEREAQNLKWTFVAARHSDEKTFETAYRILAMSQLFTIPPPQTPQRALARLLRGFLSVMPKGVIFFPFAVDYLVVRHDLSTTSLAACLDSMHTRLVVGSEFIILVALAFFSWWCLVAINAIDSLWSQNKPSSYGPPQNPSGRTVDLA